MCSRVVTPLLTALILLSAPLAHADLRVDPNPVQMDDLSETALIRVYQDGQPVRSFSTLRFVAPKYAFAMYEAKPIPNDPGAVLITPVAGRAEDGSFTLIIGAGGEQTQVDVLMTLPIRPISGVTIHLEKPDVIKLPIAPEYPLGMRILPYLDAVPGRSYEWWVNGALAASGVEKSSMEILADKVGTHSVLLKEFDGERLTAEGRTDFSVVPERDLIVDTQAGRTIRLRGANAEAGPFQRFEWFENSQLVGTGPELSYTVRTPGEHRVVLLASDPNDTSYSFAFREIHWLLRAQ